MFGRIMWFQGSKLDLESWNRMRILKHTTLTKDLKSKGPGAS